jgi:Ni/Fe-hydrogenase subunit HybB-like protein
MTPKKRLNLNLKLKLPRPTMWMAWLGFLGLLLAIGLTCGLLVFWKGLVLTNLTDLVPWGLWITIDLSSIALSAGAFTLCAAVYLIGLKRYEPVARTATFIGLIGYTMAMLALILDIGRPDRFWHAMVYWNKHSLMWEVTMCVCLYLTVLVLESMPIIANFEWLRNRFPKIVARMEHVHHYAPYLAIAGLCLSMLHQSSLGAMYGVLKARPFWYKPEMAVLFMFSAIVGGISMTIFASMLSARLTPKARINDTLLERVAHFVGWALVPYLYIRAWDWLAMTYTYQPGRTEGLQVMTKGPLSFNFWIAEILLGAIVPMILLLKQQTRQDRFWRMVALAMVVGGVIAYRWDINLSGLLVIVSYLPGEPTVTYTSYFPSLVEIGAGMGVIAFGLTAFSLGVRYLKVVDHRYATQEHETVKSEAPETVPA